MSTLPIFSSSCIAPDSSGINAYLFGVPSQGRLEAYSVNLSNPLAPTSTFISAVTTTGSAPAWDGQFSLGCYPYLGDAAPADSPITVVQFGSGTTLQAVFSPNGTWETMVGSTATATPGTDVDYVSPKFFSVVGSTDGWNWFLAKTTTNTWRDIRIGEALETGSQDLTMAGSDPLLTVGAIAQDTANFGNGLLFSFDQSGSSGTAYRAVGNKLSGPNLTATDALVTLTKASAVDLNNATLSVDAIPVTASFAALILDKGLGGTISVFSIDPRSSNFKLVQSSVFTPAPLFLPNQSVASLNSKIVIYGGFSQDAGLINSVHIFDVIAGTWYGPGLVDPTAVGSSPKAGGLSGAVIGGIAAALVVLIAVMGAAVWRIRRSRARKREEVLRGEISHGSGGGSSGSMQGDRDLPDNNDTIIRLQDMESKSQTNGDSDHAEQQLQQKQLQHKKEPASESSITLADAAMTASTTAPNTPKSTRQHAQGSNTKSSGSSTRRSSRPGQPSRQPSAHSMRSAGSGRVSLFPAGSNIYLVNSPSMLPPTPTVPSVYTMNAIDNSQSTQRHDDSPSNATSPKDDSPSAVTSPNANNKKGHVYKVNVPDAYDDRQPLHRRDTAATMVVPMDERSLMHQPISISAGSTSSPRSVNASWTTGQDPLGERSPRQLKPRSHRKSFSGGRDDASPKIPRLTSSTSIPSSPLSQQLALGENASATVTVTDANRSSQQSKKKKPYQRSKMDHADLSATHGDSGSYKNPTSPRQRQYQLQQQQQGTPSYINPAPATASVSPALSDPDAHFAEAFPLPPKLKNPRSPPSSPRRSSSERNKAQQEQYMDWYQQQQQIQVENQERLSPKTPKLRTVPRSTPKIVNK